MSRLRRTGEVPLQDVGFVRAVRSGKVTPVAAVTGFEGEKVTLADGTAISPQAVIAATGYRRGLEKMVGHLGVLDESGFPGSMAARPRLRACSSLGTPSRSEACCAISPPKHGGWRPRWHAMLCGLSWNYAAWRYSSITPANDGFSNGRSTSWLPHNGQVKGDASLRDRFSSSRCIRQPKVGDSQYPNGLFRQTEMGVDMGARVKHAVRKHDGLGRPAMLVAASVASAAVAMITAYAAVADSAARPSRDTDPAGRDSAALGGARKANVAAVTGRRLSLPAKPAATPLVAESAVLNAFDYDACTASRGVRGPGQAPDLAAIEGQGHLRPGADRHGPPDRCTRLRAARSAVMWKGGPNIVSNVYDEPMPWPVSSPGGVRLSTPAASPSRRAARPPDHGERPLLQRAPGHRRRGRGVLAGVLGHAPPP